MMEKEEEEEEEENGFYIISLSLNVTKKGRFEKKSSKLSDPHRFGKHKSSPLFLRVCSY